LEFRALFVEAEERRHNRRPDARPLMPGEAQGWPTVELMLVNARSVAGAH
jgi:hypothetical protein